MSRPIETLLQSLVTAEDPVSEIFVQLTTLVEENGIDAAIRYVDEAVKAQIRDTDVLLRAAKDFGRASDRPAWRALLAGRIAQSLCDDEGAAVDLYRTAFSRDRTEFRALDFARELYLSTGHPQQAAKLWELQVQALKVGTAARAAAMVGLAQVYLVHLDDEERARATLESTLRDFPDHADALEMLGMLPSAAPSGDASRASEIASVDAHAARPPADTLTLDGLRSWAATGPSPDELVKLVEEVETAGKGASGTRKGELAVVAGVLWWQYLGDLRRAAPHFKRVRLADAHQPDMLRFHVEQAAASSPDEHVTALIELANALPEEMVDALQTAASVAESQGDADRALDLWLMLAQQVAPGPGALDEVARLASATGKWSRYAALLREQLDGDSNRGERTELRLRLFEVLSRHADQPIAADALALELWSFGDHVAALEWLIARYHASARWPELAALHEQAARRLPARSNVHRIALAQLYLGPLKDSPGAGERVREQIGQLPSTAALPVELEALMNEGGAGELMLWSRRRQLRQLQPSERPAFAAATVERLSDAPAETQALARLDAALFTDVDPRSMADTDALIDALRAVRDQPAEWLQACAQLSGARRTGLLHEALLAAPPDWNEETPGVREWIDGVDVSELSVIGLRHLASLRAMVGDWEQANELSAQEGVLDPSLLEMLEEHAIFHSGAWSNLASSWERLQHWDRAAQAWQRAYSAADGDPSTLRRAAFAYEKAGLLDEASGAYSVIVSESEVPDAAVMLRLSELLLERGADADEIAGHALSAMAADRSAPVALQSYRVLERLGMTEKWIHALGTPDEALAQLQQLAETEPTDVGGWNRLAAFARAVGELEVAASAMGRRLGLATTPASRAQALADLASVEELAGRTSSATGYAQESLKADPANALAIDLLMRLAEVHGDTTAAAVVEPSLRELGRRADLLRLLDARATRTQPQDPTLWREVSDLALQAGDKEWALMALGRVMELSVPDEALWEALGQLTAAEDRLGRWFIALELHGMEVMQWCLPLLAAEVRRLGRTDIEVDLWERAMKLPSVLETATVALADVYERDQRWEDFVRLCDHASSSLNTAVLADLRTRAALVLAHRLHRPEPAIERLQTALMADPLHVRAFDTLLDLYQASGAHIQRELLIERRLSALSGTEGGEPELARLQLMLAKALWDENGELGKVVDRLQLAVEAGDPGSVRALAQKVFDAVGGGDPESWQTGLLIARCLEREQDDELLLAHLEDWLVRAEDMDRPAIHLRLMECHLRTGDEDSAFMHARTAATTMADATEATKVLVDAATRTGRWMDVLGVFEERAYAARSPELWLELAELYQSHSGDPSLVADAVSGALDCDSDSGPDANGLLNRLVELREAAGDAMGTARATIRRARVVASAPMDRASQLAVAAVQLVQGGHHDEALQALLAAAELDPTNAVVRESLPGLLEEQGRWAEVATMLQRRLDHEPVASVHRRLGVILRDHLADDDEAVLQFEAAGELEPSDATSWRSAAALHARAGRHAMLVTCLRRLLDCSIDDRVAVQLQLAGAILDAGAHPREAMGLLASVSATVHESDAGSRQWVELLQRMVELPLVADKASELLLSRLRESDDRAALTGLMMQRATLDLPLQERVLLLDEATAIHTELGDETAALHTALQRFELQPDLASLHPLESLARSTGGVWSVSDTFERLFVTALEPQTASAMRMCLARLLGESGDAEEAMAQAVACWLLNPADAEQRSAMTSLAGSTGRWAPLADALRQAAATVDADVGSALLVEAAEIDLEYLDAADRAMEALRHAVVLQPANATAHRMLAALAQRRGTPEQYADALRAWAGAVPEGERAAIWMQLAAVSRDMLGDLNSSVEWLQKVLELEPTHQQALIYLQSALEKSGRWRAFVELMERHPPRLAEDFLRLTRAQLLHLDRADAASGLLESLRTSLAAASDASRQASLNTFARICLESASRPQADDIARLQLGSICVSLFEETEDEVRFAAALRLCVASTQDLADRSRMSMQLAMAIHEVDPNGAWDSACSAIRDQPASREAFEVALRLAGELDRYADLVQHATALSDEVPPAQSRVLLEWAADVAETMLEKPAEGASLRLRAVLSDPAASHLDLVEQVAADPDGPLARLLWERASSDERALEVLRTALGEKPSNQTRARLIQVSMDHVTTDVARSAALSEMAELTDNPQQRLEQLLEAARLDPANAGLLHRLSELAEDMASAVSIVAVLEDASSATSDMEPLLMAADIWMGPADDPQAAIDLLQPLFERDPSDVRVVDRLTAALSTTEQWLELAEMLERHAPTLTAVEAYAARIRAASLLEDVGQFGRALDLLEQLPAAEERHELFDRMADAAHEVQRWYDDLVRRPGTGDAGLDGERWLKAAWCAQRLENGVEQAISALQQAIRIPEVAAEARTQLLDLYRATEQWELLAETLAALAEAAGEDERPDLMRQQVLALELAGDETGLIRLMQRMARDDGYDSAADHELRDYLSHHDRWAELKAWLQELAAPGDRPDVLRELAQLHEEQLDDPTGARLWLERALDAMAPTPPDTRLLSDYARICARAGDAQSAVQVLERSIQAGAPVDGPLNAALAGLQRAAGQPASVWLATLRLALDAGHVTGSMIELLESASPPVDPQLLAVAFSRAVEQRVALSSAQWVRWAQTRAQQGRRADATSALAAIVQRGEGDAQVVRTLVELLIESGSFNEATASLEAWAERPAVRSSRKDLPVVHYLRGRVALATGNPSVALDAFRHAMTLDTSYVPNLMALTTLLLGKGDLDGAERTASAALQYQGSVTDVAEKARLFRLVGEVRRRAGDETRAADMFARAAALE